MKISTSILLFSFMLISAYSSVSAQSYRLRYDANSVILNSQTTEIITDNRLSNKKGITLKQGVTEALNGERTEPDITFNIKAPAEGKFVMTTYALTNAEGDAIFDGATSEDQSLYIRLQFDDQEPMKRVVAVPWIRPLQNLGRFVLSGNGQVLKIWLPRGIVFEYAEFNTYESPTVPVSVYFYTPEYFPPTSHPRLWVTQETLPSVKAKLTDGMLNALMWGALQTRVKIPFDMGTVTPGFKNLELEKAFREKAFYYVMTGDETVGKEVVNLMNIYLPSLQFGNALSGTREIGETIYTASLVYDWCYSLISTEQKQVWIQSMINFAEDMEIGWPPFKQPVVAGHGNEAQMSRDLLSMAIATSDENPIAYKYCSYTVLKQLIPFKQFEFQSPRHPQGTNYGAYRTGWDLHAALYYKIMTGKELFDPNIIDLFKFWTYMRTPQGQMLRDGDGFNASAPGVTSQYYFKNAFTMLLGHAYSKSPYLKSEFLKQGGNQTIEPYLYLLLNEPKITAVEKHNYPLTLDFGDVSGGMVARTGWNSVDDVLVEIRGGGYRSGGHQHSDAGAVQLYYRGFQFGDIGQYLFAGTPYDQNFNRRSVAHSMMLTYDPSEDFGSGLVNDGGQRFNRFSPITREDAMSTPSYDNGKVVSASFGVSETAPVFNYFSVDLAAAYSSKISKYVRSFCFINTKRKDIPGIIILTDDVTASNANYKKFWQINTHNLPVQTAEGLILENKAYSSAPVGKTHVNMLLPKPDARTTQILDGKSTFTVDGVYFSPPDQPFAEKTGKRTLISPKTSSNRDRFLTVMQMADGNTTPFPVSYVETAVSYVVTIDNKIVSLSNSANLIGSSFQITIPADKSYQLALLGLKEGSWILQKSDGSTFSTHEVIVRSNTIFIESIPAGTYTLTRDLNSSVNDNYEQLDLFVTNKIIIINKEENPLFVYDIAGNLIFSDMSFVKNNVDVSVKESGVYIVRSGKKVSKVLVR